MEIFNHAKLLLEVSRPIFWTIGPALYVSGFIHSGFYPRTMLEVMIGVLLSFPICLITFGVNDVYDFHSDLKNPRKNNLWTDGAVLHQEDHDFLLYAASVSTGLVLFVALSVSIKIKSPQFFGCIISLLLLVWAYSCPPLRLKERPVLDSICNGLICWLFWTCGYVFHGDTLLSPAADEAASNGYFIIFYTAAFHSLGAMVDGKPDASAGHRTIATILGQRVAALFSSLCFYSAWKMVDPKTDLGIATAAGVAISLALTFKPEKAYVLTRLAFIGSYLGMITWILIKIHEIKSGKNVAGSWSTWLASSSFTRCRQSGL